MQGFNLLGFSRVLRTKAADRAEKRSFRLIIYSGGLIESAFSHEHHLSEVNHLCKMRLSSFCWNVESIWIFRFCTNPNSSIPKRMEKVMIVMFMIVIGGGGVVILQTTDMEIFHVLNIDINLHEIATAIIILRRFCKLLIVRMTKGGCTAGKCLDMENLRLHVQPLEIWIEGNDILDYKHNKGQTMLPHFSSPDWTFVNSGSNILPLVEACGYNGNHPKLWFAYLKLIILIFAQQYSPDLISITRGYTVPYTHRSYLTLHWEILTMI